jgi:NAD(P)H-flavin reductase
MTLSVLVQSRAGFTAELDRRRQRSLLAFIDGPYNATHDLGGYGTVVMLASGMGIAGHMPYVKELIHGYNSCEVETRRVLVVWQLDEECECWRLPLLTTS